MTTAQEERLLVIQDNLQYALKVLECRVESNLDYEMSIHSLFIPDCSPWLIATYNCIDEDLSLEDLQRTWKMQELIVHYKNVAARINWLITKSEHKVS